MSLLNPRKLRKLRNDPKLFFQDAFKKRLIPLGNALKKYKPKKREGYSKYVIVSAVYNVEKYLDDYFKSIINQRLDFEKNIHIVCVDDGSTDNSANIIKSYQKKYPKNITYLYKENGGQASARNLGLKYLQENESLKDKFTWVTFTDPDDFLDNGYFYEVDEFLVNHQDDDIGMVGSNILVYQENKNIYTKHFTYDCNFKSKINVLSIGSLKEEIIVAGRVLFLHKIIQEYNILFPDKFNYYEDALFYIHYISVCNKSSKCVFLESMIYYLRKRSSNDSATNKAYQDLNYYIGSLRENVLKTFVFSVGKYSQNFVIAHLIWHLKYLVDSSEKLSFMSKEEQQEYLRLLDKIFSYIDTETIISAKYSIWFSYKVGMLNCFKNEYPPFQITYIEDFDVAKRQILLRYFTPDDKDIESIRIDGREVYVDIEKIIQHDFLVRVFTYEKRMWVKIPDKARILEVFIRGRQARIAFSGKQYRSFELSHLYKKFDEIDKVRAREDNLWLFMDRDYEADDNAERLYRYVMQNYPKQSIVFALRPVSSDYERLKIDGFNLIEFESNEFKKLIQTCSKVISSHLDHCLIQYVKKYDKDFVLLEHGETIASNCANWFNMNKCIKLITVSCQKEYEYIACNYTKYNLTKKEVKVTGFARYDNLLENNKKNNKQILIMPTWRMHLVGEKIVGTGIRTLNPELLQSEYFIRWKHFLQSEKLKMLSEGFGFQINFYPHFQIRDYLEYFECPSYINVIRRRDGEPLYKYFQNSDMLITDYSSINFTMAYLEKPVIYYQFDKIDLLQGLHHQQETKFNYETDGFGPVVTTEEDLLRELEILLQNNCKVGEPYKSNIENTFAFRDGKCCERIYQEILKLDEPYQNEISLDYVKQKAQDALEHECYLEAMWRFQYLLENSENFSEEIAKNCLEAAMEIGKGYEIAKILLQKDCQKMSRDLKFLIIKNILSNKKAPKEEVERCLEILETMETPQGKEKEFLLSKLRIYFYLANRKRINEIIGELQTKYGVSKEDIHFEMLFTTNAISLWGGGGNY